MFVKCRVWRGDKNTHLQCLQTLFWSAWVRPGLPAPCLPAYPPLCLPCPACLSACLPACLPAYLPTCLAACLSPCLVCVLSQLGGCEGSELCALNMGGPRRRPPSANPHTSRRTKPMGAGSPLEGAPPTRPSDQLVGRDWPHKRSTGSQFQVVPPHPRVTLTEGQKLLAPVGHQGCTGSLRGQPTRLVVASQRRRLQSNPEAGWVMGRERGRARLL